ncbi:MAG: Peptidyl-tRNA hydrolase [Parcubacteria group bacterium Gr01-1014_107]|nr:MAG: Peptidyl-tRNA hydrolase [Parcubacteria group bacterium Gr01-1014_107]
MESIEKSLRTRKFIRIRVGISSTTTGGKIRKPQGEQAVLDFILGEFKKSEEENLKKVIQTAAGALEDILEKGLEKSSDI